MAAALAYAVPISSLEEEKDTLRMPEWNKVHNLLLERHNKCGRLFRLDN